MTRSFRRLSKPTIDVGLWNIVPNKSFIGFILLKQFTHPMVV